MIFELNRCLFNSRQKYALTKGPQSWVQQRTSSQTSDFKNIFQQISTIYGKSGARGRELIIVTNAVPAINHASQWPQGDLDQLAQIKAEWFKGVNIRAVPINAPCTQYRNQRYAEDCAYFEALAMIDSYNDFSLLNEPVLCRSGKLNCEDDIDRIGICDF